MKKSKRVDPGAVVRKMRSEAKLSQGELARILGIAQTVLSKFELGQAKLPLPALLVVADACGYEIQAVSRRGWRTTLKSPAHYERVGVRVARSPKVSPKPVPKATTKVRRARAA